MRPKLTHSPMTGSFYIATRYRPLHGPARQAVGSPLPRRCKTCGQSWPCPYRDTLVASTKYDVTSEVATLVIPMIKEALRVHQLEMTEEDPLAATCSCGDWARRSVPMSAGDESLAELIEADWANHLALRALDVEAVA